MTTQIEHVIISYKGGAFAAASVREIESFDLPNGEKYERHLDPRPLSAADLDALMGLVGADAMSANEQLTAQLAAQTEALAQLDAITAERDALLAQIAELTAPPTGRVLTIEQYRDRFTSDELVAVLRAAYADDTNCQLLLLKVQTATTGIDLDSESVLNGLAYLTAIGILAPGRAGEIVA